MFNTFITDVGKATNSALRHAAIQMEAALLSSNAQQFAKASNSLDSECNDLK